MFYYLHYIWYLHYTICISAITHYVLKYHSKSIFNAHWNLFWSKSSMELSPEFHGTFWTTFEQHLWFHGIPWNLSNKTSSSMEFHGIPWNFVQVQSFMEFHGTISILPSSTEFHGTFNFPKKSSMEFHGIPWNLINFIVKKIIFLNIVFGIWLMVRCYLAKISQKRYILHWFQYRNSYCEHPGVSENGTRSAKMACCWVYFDDSARTTENPSCWWTFHRWPYRKLSN